MVNFGLIDEWTPRPGRVTTWTMARESLAAAAEAPIDVVPPSHQQEEYLRAALRNTEAGFRFSRLCLEAFDFEGVLNVDALTRALNTYLRRHDTFRSWFSAEPDGTIARHVVDSELLTMVPTQHGDMDTPQAIRHHVQDETPGPFNWDCFTFGAIEWEGGFTVYGAVDHLNTDGISQALTCSEIITLYLNEAFGLNTQLPPVGSYLRFCEHERTVSREVTRESETFRTWIRLVQENGGRLPTFPMPLDKEAEGYTRSALYTATVFDEDMAQKFDAAGREHGANMTASVLAVAAIASTEFTGKSDYLGMTPKSTRAPGDELNSVGWFTNLIPVPIHIHADDTFASLATTAAKSYNAGKELTHVSFHRVLQLVEPEDGIDVPEGWSVPMVSYIDVRKLPGVDMFDAINGCLFGNRGSSEEVFLWINRFKDHTSITLLFPDTEIAHKSVQTYVQKLTSIMNTVATQGNYHPVVPAMT